MHRLWVSDTHEAMGGALGHARCSSIMSEGFGDGWGREGIEDILRSIVKIYTFVNFSINRNQFVGIHRGNCLASNPLKAGACSLGGEGISRSLERE